MEAPSLKIRHEHRHQDRFACAVTGRGRADWPQLTLRYAVLEGRSTMRAGEARLADMAHFFDRHRLSQYGDLPFEQRMLDRWFKQEVAPTPP